MVEAEGETEDKGSSELPLGVGNDSSAIVFSRSPFVSLNMVY